MCELIDSNVIWFFKELELWSRAPLKLITFHILDIALPFNKEVWFLFTMEWFCIVVCGFN